MLVQWIAEATLFGYANGCRRIEYHSTSIDQFFFINFQLIPLPSTFYLEVGPVPRNSQDLPCPLYIGTIRRFAVHCTFGECRDIEWFWQDAQGVLKKSANELEKNVAATVRRRWSECFQALGARGRNTARPA